MTSHFKPVAAGFASLEGIPQIARFTLHGSVLNQLRDMVIEGKLLPGMRLNESHLGRILGVSRTPLREAIKSLAGEGLIEIRPARGAIVRVLSAEDIRNTLEVIALLEQAAGRVLCARGAVAALEELESLHRGHAGGTRQMRPLGLLQVGADLPCHADAPGGKPGVV